MSSNNPNNSNNPPNPSSQQLVSAVNNLTNAVQNQDDVADELVEIRRVLERIETKMNTQSD